LPISCSWPSTPAIWSRRVLARASRSATGMSSRSGRWLTTFWIRPSCAWSPPPPPEQLAPLRPHRRRPRTGPLREPLALIAELAQRRLQALGPLLELLRGLAFAVRRGLLR